MGGGGRQWGEGEKDRAEREVSVRRREEVQEVPWGQLVPGVRGGAGGARFAGVKEVWRG